MLVVVPAVTAVGPADAVVPYPMLVVAALSFVDVAWMPILLAGEIRPLALIVVNAAGPGVLAPIVALMLPLEEFNAVKAPAAGVVPPIGTPLMPPPPEIDAPDSTGFVPNTSAPEPVSSETMPASCADVVVANCASVPLVKANAVPHEKPVANVYRMALFEVLQLGIAMAVGAALDAVALPSSVFAACAASAAGGTLPHPGAVTGPLDSTTWPAVEPAPLMS